MFLFIELYYTPASLQTNKKTAPCPKGADGAVLLAWRLGARYVLGGRAFVSLDDLKGDGIADLQFIEHNASQLLGVEEQILRLAFAGNESESLLGQGLDNSVHVIVFYFVKFDLFQRLSQ